MKESTKEGAREGKGDDGREKFSRRQKNVLNNLQAGVENGTCAFERDASMQPSAARVCVCVPSPLPPPPSVLESFASCLMEEQELIRRYFCQSNAARRAKRFGA